MEENKEKKIKFIRRTLLLLTAISLSLALIIPVSKKITSTVNKEITKVLTPEKLDFSFDNVYSTTVNASLTSFLKQHSKPEKLAEFEPKKFYSDLKKKFKIIKKVEWDFSNPKSAKLYIQGVKPLCKINNKFILGNKKRLFDPDVFPGIELKNIELSSDFFNKKISTALFDLINKTPEQIWQKYNLSFIKPYDIEMQLFQTNLKKQPVLIVDMENFFNIEKIETTNKIVPKLAEEIDKKLGRQKIACLDLRFKNRIIYYKRSEIKNIGGGIKNE
jgi:hypothetical protein